MIYKVCKQKILKACADLEGDRGGIPTPPPLPVENENFIVKLVTNMPRTPYPPGKHANYPLDPPPWAYMPTILISAGFSQFDVKNKNKNPDILIEIAKISRNPDSQKI